LPLLDGVSVGVGEMLGRGPGGDGPEGEEGVGLGEVGVGFGDGLVGGVGAGFGERLGDGTDSCRRGVTGLGAVKPCVGEGLTDGLGDALGETLGEGLADGEGGRVALLALVGGCAGRLLLLSVGCDVSEGLTLSGVVCVPWVPDSTLNVMTVPKAATSTAAAAATARLRREVPSAGCSW
jgi:hypothetical protein